MLCQTFQMALVQQTRYSLLLEFQSDSDRSSASNSGKESGHFDKLTEFTGRYCMPEASASKSWVRVLTVTAAESPSHILMRVSKASRAQELVMASFKSLEIVPREHMSSNDLAASKVTGAKLLFNSPCKW